MIFASIFPSGETKPFLKEAFSPVMFNFFTIPVFDIQSEQPENESSLFSILTNDNSAKNEKEFGDYAVDDIFRFGFFSLQKIYSAIFPYKSEYLQYLGGLRHKYNLKDKPLFFAKLSYLYKVSDVDEKCVSCVFDDFDDCDENGLSEISGGFVHYTLKDYLDDGISPAIPIDEMFFKNIEEATILLLNIEKISDPEIKSAKTKELSEKYLSAYEDFFLTLWDFFVGIEIINSKNNTLLVKEGDFLSKYLSKAERGFVRA